MNVFSRKAITLLEVLIGIIIFSVAMLPLLSLSQSATRDTYSMAKHLIASQLAASIMERVLVYPFSKMDELKAATTAVENGVEVEAEMAQEGEPGPGKIVLLSHKTLAVMLKNMPEPSGEKEKGMNLQQGVSKAFSGFKYKVEFPDITEDVVTVKVTVTWPQREGDPNSKRLELSRWALKFRED